MDRDDLLKRLRGMTGFERGIKITAREAADYIEQLEQEVSALKHDMERGMANHNADLNALRPEAATGWRNPKDRPPNLPGEHHSADALLSMKRYGDHGIRIGHVSCGHWRPSGGNGNFDDDVLGWMPLPDAGSPQNEESKDG